MGLGILEPRSTLTGGHPVPSTILLYTHEIIDETNNELEVAGLKKGNGKN